MALSTIRGRLTVLVLLSLLPVLLLGWLFGAQVSKDIAFAKKERAGLDYLQVVSADLVPALLGRTLPSGPAVREAAGVADPALGTAALSEDYIRLRDTPDDPAYWAAAAALIARIGDGSNLILDPDLDSFYLMDMGVVKFPGAIAAAGRVIAHARASIATDVPEPKALAAFVAGLSEFRTASAGLGASFQSAQTGAAGAELARTLGTTMTVALAQSDRLASATQAVLDAPDRAGRAAALNTMEAALGSYGEAMDVAARLTLDSLDGLLAARIDRLTLWLIQMLGLSGALVFAVIVGSWLLARSILRNVRRFGDDVRAMAEDRSVVSFSQAAVANEIGEIARAVEYLRERTVAEIIETEAAKAEEEAKAAALETQQAEARAAQLEADAREADAMRPWLPNSPVGSAVSRRGRSTAPSKQSLQARWKRCALPSTARWRPCAAPSYR